MKHRVWLRLCSQRIFRPVRAVPFRRQCWWRQRAERIRKQGTSEGKNESGACRVAASLLWAITTMARTQVGMTGTWSPSIDVARRASMTTSWTTIAAVEVVWVEIRGTAYRGWLIARYRHQQRTVRRQAIHGCMRALCMGVWICYSTMLRVRGNKRTISL